jgi:hypothetical protein
MRDNAIRFLCGQVCFWAMFAAIRLGWITVRPVVAWIGVGVALSAYAGLILYAYLYPYGRPPKRAR